MKKLLKPHEKLEEEDLSEIDTKELSLPETTFVRDIESRVFQAIVLQTLAKIDGISFLGSGLIDNLLGRDSSEKVKGIYVEQDQKKHSVQVRVEVNIVYGISIPEKAEEIQNKIVAEISNLTGLHVSSVHVVFKNLITHKPEEVIEEQEKEKAQVLQEDEYSDGF